MTIGGTKSIPKPALILGFMGLLPFVSMACIAVIQSPEVDRRVINTLLVYGALILSFLGGVRWGIAINDTSSLPLLGPLFVSVIPSLVAWVACLVTEETGLFILTVGFCLMLHADHKLPGAPDWYLRLRIPLSLAVVVSLLTVLVSY